MKQSPQWENMYVKILVQATFWEAAFRFSFSMNYKSISMLLSYGGSREAMKVQLPQVGLPA